MESLPPKHLLLEACRGLAIDGHLVLKCACRLSELHELRLNAAPGSTLDIDRDRAQLVSDIDRWVADELPRAHGSARMHTETVGTVIDRLAQFSALAYLTLTWEPEWVVRDAWRRLSDLAVAYDDLAGEVTAGLCRLPDLSGHHEYE
ncbi:hypothetical protein NONO_c71190 [Nocardia nova SH22a]|uniref:DUF4254 domain-containing protein n=1 Tax=Nocardia nova SH22a TaxID=1415166 RepID=W5TRB1_9NOCA|nr:DUF4254 domain-containing protein [Nocardia nova]AHH21880.1 hypothetical protein NONO_c71190 [Nocardia nova SH22a]